MSASMPSITFAPDSDGTLFSVFNEIALREYVVDIIYNDGIIGFPGDGVTVVEADDDGIKVCEVELGVPLRNATWHVGYDEIKTLTIR